MKIKFKLRKAKENMCVSQYNVPTELNSKHK